jgi:peptide chain release factor subunit 1
MLNPKEAYGLLVIGRKESAVGYIKGNKVEVLKEFTSGLHGKHRAGGQSQKRYERLIEEGEKRFYRRISDTINEIFINMEDFQGMFIGGPGASKEKFVSDDSLDYRLREKILDVVDLGYGGVEGIRALIEKIKDSIANLKYIREKKVMQRFMKEISNDSGLVSYGLEAIQKALNYGAVDTLIFSEKLDLFKVKIECSNCGHTEEKIGRELNLEKIKASIQEESCPQCGSNTFNAVESLAILTELGAIGESTGAEISIISTETEEGEMLYSTFGGIAAILRYKIDY